MKKVITTITCDFCKKERNTHNITLPTVKNIGTKEIHCYEDVYKDVEFISYLDEKKLDVCDECLNKIFNAFGKEKGSLI